MVDLSHDILNLRIICSVLDPDCTLTDSIEHSAILGVEVLCDTVSKVKSDQACCGKYQSIEFAIVRIELAQPSAHIASDVLHNQMWESPGNLSSAADGRCTKN